MKFTKRIYTTSALFLAALTIVNAQEKQTFGNDAKMPRWYVGAGLFGGTQMGSIDQNNWSASYLNALNANIADVKQSKGSNLGFNLSLGYFPGKKRNFGIGTGLQYLNQSTTLEVHHMAVEYQSTDNAGSTFRQRLRSNGMLSEKISQNTWGVPVMLLYKKQLNERWGMNLDAGVIFNLATSARYDAGESNFDYEAVYKLDNNGNPVYDNSPVPDPNSWLITKAHYEKVNNDGKVNAYFEDLYGKGYNVGLGVKPNAATGDVKHITVSSSWIIRPGISYRIKPNLALHGNIAYQQVTTSFMAMNNYRITDQRGAYETMTHGIKSNSQGLIQFGVGIRYYFGKERVKPVPPPSPPPAPVPAPEPKPAPVVVEPKKEDPYKEMVGVTVKLQDEKYGRPVPGNILIKKGAVTVYDGKADQSGISKFYLEPGNYTVGVTAKGYIPAEETLQLNVNEKGTSKVIELKQPKIEKGLVFKLKAINFETGSNQLTTTSYDILNRMAEILLEYPQMVIEVAGHTDNVGNDQANLSLSQKRADAVKAYLIEKGVKASQMKAVGYGETQPVATNDTEEGRLQNRRVMFTVLEF